MRIFYLAAVVLTIAALACSKSSEPESAPAPSAPAPSAPAPAMPAAPDKPAAAPASPPSAAAADAPTAGGLTWRAAGPLVARTPKSSMRVAEYGLEGEPAAELTVFYFGADQGGSIEANMTRWIGQFTQPDGSETKAKRDERMVKGIPVALVEAKGNFSGGMAMPGAPAPSAQTDAMLLGAIAKGPNGAVFFKFTGPRASLEKARPAFESLIDSITPAS
jgi:glucose/arabinose dehydrogenase